jgi:DNA-binding transcriptional LysR family regulator
MWITLDQILCLQAVSDSGSISGASEVLHKAKSAISYSLNRLDEQLGFATLDRSQYRIRLTPQGEAFLRKAQPLLKDMEDLKEEAHKIASGVEMKLSMSATAIFPRERLNKVLREIITRFPATEFTFHREILSGEKMLLDEQVDIAIFESLRNTLDIDHKKIARVDLKLVISARHPFLKLTKKQQTMEALTDYPHIIQRSTLPDPKVMGSSEGDKRWSVSDLDSKKDLIVNNLGWGRLPEHIIASELKSKKLVHLKHLKYDHRLDIYLCKKKGRPVGPVLQHIWEAF